MFEPNFVVHRGFYFFTIDTKKQFYYVVRHMKKKYVVDPSG